MPDSQPLDFLPLWVIYLLTVLVLLLAAEAGFRLGKLVQKRWPDRSEAGVGTMVGAALALLGFLLAFVTTIVIGHFNDRRQLVISEANAIGTTYLRAGYLADPSGVDSRRLLREYVNQRLYALDPGRTEAAIARSEEIHGELWGFAEELARANPDPITALYIASLNEVIDIHTERLNAELGFRIPPTILLGLYLVAILTMVLVGLFDSYQEKHNMLALALVILILSVVFMVIVDLDRSNVGLIQTPQQALIDLRNQLISAP
jgi:hypothetical protein